MKHYLSSGMGVNSVALHLLMLREGYDFEAVFVNHGGDWPETYNYLEIFQKYLKRNGHKPVHVLFPDVNTVEKKRFSKIYDYFFFKRSIPVRQSRQCTDRFKVRVLKQYFQKPCFVHIGIDAGESHRASISIESQMENRYLLIEYGIDRIGCERLIQDHGLHVPMKSGCYFCPFQKKGQFIELRKKHPDLFCKAETLEKNRIAEHKKPIYIKDVPLSALVDEKQIRFDSDEYPPCQCGL